MKEETFKNIHTGETVCFVSSSEKSMLTRKSIWFKRYLEHVRNSKDWIEIEPKSDKDDSIWWFDQLEKWNDN